MCSHHRNAFPHQYHGIHEAHLPAELHPECTAIEYIGDKPAVSPPAFLLVVDLVLDEEELKASLVLAYRLESCPSQQFKLECKGSESSIGSPPDLHFQWQTSWPCGICHAMEHSCLEGKV